ncbi:MAG: DegT/DnrJ/EryC1/StrS family aminotransferase [Longimicrobiales bacterium]|nr:DegT/DnrJ/EryC1/StrS family aminotransferase [Longimicrobiales bacterium]
MDPRARLELHLHREMHAGEVLLTGNGTMALEIAIRTAQIRVGGSPAVALPAFTCFDVATAAVAAEPRVLLYDLDPETLAPDLDSLEDVLRRGGRVVVVSPLFGVPPEWDELRQLTDAYGAVVVEDAAQGVGASWRTRALGSLGDLSVMSFGRGKGWTGGEGGAVLSRGSGETWWDDLQLPAPSKARELRVLASLLGQVVFGCSELYWVPASLPFLQLGRTVYRPPEELRGLSRLAAAVLLRARTDALEAAEGRRRIGDLYRAQLASAPSVRHIRFASGAMPGLIRYPLLLHGGFEGLPSPALARRLGMEASYPGTLLDVLPLRPFLDDPSPALPGAEELARRLVTLPTHDQVSPEEVQEVIALLQDCGPVRGAPEIDRPRRGPRPIRLVGGDRNGSRPETGRRPERHVPLAREESTRETPGKMPGRSLPRTPGS